MIGRNAMALVASQIVTKALNLAVAVVLVRWLGADELGRYAYVLAFCFPFGALADFGVATLAIREASAQPARAGAVIAAARRLTAGLGLAAVLVMMAVAILTGHEPRLLAAFALAGLGSLLSAFTLPYLVGLTAREELRRLSLHRVVGSVTGGMLTLAVLLAGGGLLALFAAGVATSVLMLVLARALAGRALACSERAPVGAMARQALPFGLLMIGFALYYRVDMVMLEWMAGSRAVGVYAAAYRFLDVVIVLAASLTGPLFPRLSAVARARPDEARRLLEDAWRPLLALGLPLSIGAWALAPLLVGVLFGDAFADSAPLLRVLIWATLPLFWVSVANHALIAADRVWPLVAVYAASAALNVIANLLLIPRFGAAGAAAATLACEWLNLAAVVVLVRSAFGVSLSWAGLWRYAGAAALMLAGVWVFREAGLAAAVVAGAALYGGALWALGYLGSADHVAMKRLLAQ
ncbi:MAG TPA: flippase [Candidatus Limnocylindria bacterium]|nr:flippase [Candidatus Limnocylindria bacterium]